MEIVTLMMLKKAIYYKRKHRSATMKRPCRRETRAAMHLTIFFANANGQGFQQQATKGVTLLLFALVGK